MSIIKHIKIENLSYKMDNNDFNDRLNDLSRVNIFVGANNSGKSRFMRSLFYNNKIPLKFFPNDTLFEEYLEMSKKFKSYENSIINPYSSEKQRAYDDIKMSLKEISYIEESKTPLPELISVYKTGVVNVSPSHEHLLKPYSEYFETFFPNLKFNDQLFNYDFYKIYILSLRSLIPIIFNKDAQNYELKQDFYAERIKRDYFSDDSEIKTDILDYLIRDDSINDSEEIVDLAEFIEKTYFPKNSIMSGQRFYDYVKNYLLGDLEQREMIREYENYLSETFFDKKDVVLIPKVNDDVLTVKIDYEEYKIYDLGEGIQSIILMTLPLFLYLDKSKEKNTNVLVFIEEPEIGLHPRLQRIFIETLLDERFENYQFFFTTHSNHFIDQTLESEEISIYLFDKLLNEGVSNVEFHIKPINLDYYPALKKLGALPSSVLISNCTILVEGTYDIPHYTLYLDLYQKHLQEKNPNFRMYKEDVHYSFFRGGGNETLNTIDEFNDYENERNFFISDSDDENKKEKLEQYFLEIGYDNFYILDVKEVENLISKKVLLKILKNMRETKNLDISDDFNEIDYQKSHFYNFITKNIIKETLPDNFMGEEGFKKRFSFKEKKFAKDYNDLSEPAKLVAKEIFRFIEKNNPVI